MKQLKHKLTGLVYGWNKDMAASGTFDEIEFVKPTDAIEAIPSPSAPASTIAEINADLGQLDELHNT